MGCVVEKAATKRHLEMASEAKRSHEFFDVHVHPFEIFFNDFRLEGQMSGEMADHVRLADSSGRT